MVFEVHCTQIVTISAEGVTFLAKESCIFVDVLLRRNNNGHLIDVVGTCTHAH